MNFRPIRPGRGPLDATVRAPGSKSVTHRALVVAALATGDSEVRFPLDSEDIRATVDGLRAVGAVLEPVAGHWRVRGCGASVAGGGEANLGESGTSMRLLAAVAALGGSPTRFQGAGRLADRPMEELYGALRALGATVETAGPDRALPARIGGSTMRGGRVVVGASRSSQFASALLCVGARLPGGIEVRLDPPVVSRPYIDLTVEVLGAFGIAVRQDGERRWSVREAAYAGRRFDVECDHSAAAFLEVAAAVRGGTVHVEGLRAESVQPDARLGRLLREIGCDVSVDTTGVRITGGGAIPGFEVDLSEAPDLAPAVSILALFSPAPCTLHGLSHLRFKESDRLTVLASNLAALGRAVEIRGDSMHFAAQDPGMLAGVRIATAGDHRIAMAFAVAGLVLPGVEIADPDCVAKSYPGFWDDLARLGGG